MSDAVFKSLPREALALGAPLAYFPNHPSRCLRMSVWQLIRLAAVMLAFFSFSAVAFWWTVDRGRDDFLFPAVIVAAFGLALALVGIWAIWPALESAQVRGVVTFPDGLAGLTARGVVVVPWTETVEVRDYGCALRTRSGPALELPVSIDSRDQLADLVLRSTYAPLSLSVEESLALAKSVTFGPILVRPDGLQIAGALLTWDRLGEMRVHGDCLSVSLVGASGPLFRVSLELLPNWHVLRGIIGRRQARDSDAGAGTAPAPSSVPETAVRAAELERLREPRATGDPITVSRPGPAKVPRRAEVSAQPAADQASAGRPALAEPVLAEYAPKSGQAHVFLWIALVTVLLSPIVLYAGVRMARTAMTTGEEQSAKRVFLLGAGMLTLGAICGVMTAWAQGVRVAVSPAGLTFRTAWGKVTCRWEEIEEQTWEERRDQGRHGPLNPTRLYHLRCRDGQRISLDDRIADFEGLVAQVQRQTARCQLPELLGRLRAGRVIQFGTFAATRAGILWNGMTLDWEEITRATTEGGVFTLERRGAWISWGNVPLTQVPNAHLLVALATRMAEPGP